MTKITSVRTQEPDYVVEAEAVRIGPDILVYVWGGERPHIGAVAAAQPRPSLADPNRTSATASVLSYVGHKEDGVAKEMAEAISARFNTNRRRTMPRDYGQGYRSTGTRLARSMFFQKFGRAKYSGSFAAPPRLTHCDTGTVREMRYLVRDTADEHPR
jgi:hypothetical protein